MRARLAGECPLLLDNKGHIKHKMKILKEFIGIQNPSYLVKAKATYHKFFTELWVPNDPYQKLKDGWELHNALDLRTMRGQSENREESIERSIRRTKREVRNLAGNNDFQWFVTFTMAKDRQNDEKTFKKLENWLKSEKRRYGNFKYLIVPERHKDGAIHFHGLLGDYHGVMIEARNKSITKKQTDSNQTTYNVESYKHGFTMAGKIQSPQRVATYISKYITKDMYTAEFNKKRYWTSRNLKKPTTEENPLWVDQVQGKETRRVVLEQGTLLYYPPMLVPTN